MWGRIQVTKVEQSQLTLSGLRRALPILSTAHVPIFNSGTYDLFIKQEYHSIKGRPSGPREDIIVEPMISKAFGSICNRRIWVRQLLHISRRLLTPTGTSNGDASLRSFRSHDLHSVSGSRTPDHEQHHWTSKPLQDEQYLSRITFRCRNRGRLWLSLLSSSLQRGHKKTTHKARRCLARKVTSHGWCRFVLEIGRTDQLRRLARAGDQ